MLGFAFAQPNLHFLNRQVLDIIYILISALSPGGQILIITGQTDYVPVWIAGSSYWYFSCPDHIVFLNQKFSHWLQQNFQSNNVCYFNIRHFSFQWRLFFLNWLG